MKRSVSTLISVAIFVTGSAFADQADQSMTVMRNVASMPLAFTANHGQWDDKVQFRANAGGATMWFSPDGAYYQFIRRIKRDDIDPFGVGQDPCGPDISGRQTPSSAPDMMHQPDSIEIMMIKANFVGANPNPIMVGIHMMEYKCNYFIGNDPNEWYTDVPNYSAVLYEQVYDGIDLKYYGNGKQMEYDFIVEPGADFSQIKIQYDGAESIAVNDNGELVVTTKWGEVVEQKPVIYQIENGSRIAVSGDYDIKGASAFGFKMTGDFDNSLPLVIDPVLSYSTYLGEHGGDYGRGIAVDASGAAYVVGYTNSTDFPTENPYQTYQGGG